MSSNNNPQTTPQPPAADPSAQPAPAPAPAADDGISTVVHVGGKEYDTTNLPTAAGLEIFRALPLESQLRAKVTASIVATFASLQKVAANNGLDPTELAKKWLTSVSNTNAAKAAVAQFSDAEKKAVAEFNAAGANAREVAEMVPGGRAILGISDTARGAATVGGVAIDITGAVADGVWNGAPRIWNMLTTMKTEALGQILGYGSGNGGEQSVAFGAAVEALRLETMNKRHGLPLIDWPTTLGGKPSQVFENPVAYASAGMSWLGEWIVHAMPGIAKYVIGTYKWMTYSGEGKPTWAQMCDEAERDINEAAKTHPADSKRFAELADAAMVSYENDVTRKALLKAKVVADIPTEGVADAVTAPDVTVRDTDGVDSHIKDGKVVDQVTPGQRLGAAAHAIVGDGPWYEQGVRGTGAVVGLGWLGVQPVRGAFEGLARQQLTRPANRAEAAEAKVRRLQGFDDPKTGKPIKGEIELAEAQKDAKVAQLEAQKGVDGHRFNPWKTSQAEIDKLDNKITAMKAEAVKSGQDAAKYSTIAADAEAKAPGWLKTAATPLKEINDGSKLSAVWNAPRSLFRGIGDFTTKAVTGTANLAWGATKGVWNSATGLLTGGANTGVGFTKGVHAVVNDETVKGATLLEKAGILGGKALSHTAKIADPVFAGLRALHDVGAGDAKGATVNTAELVGMGGLMAKVGFGRALPGMAPIASGGEFINAAVHGDGKGMKSSATDMAIIGSFALTGAGVGLLGGPFAPVTSSAGALVGTTIGGFVVGGRAIYNYFAGESTPAPQPAAPAAIPVPARVEAAAARNVAASAQPARVAAVVGARQANMTHDELVDAMRDLIKKDPTLMTQLNTSVGQQRTQPQVAAFNANIFSGIKGAAVGS